MEIWTKEGNVKIPKVYNPCRQLVFGHLKEIWEESKRKLIWCGYFNAHSTLWGVKDGINGGVIEELIAEKELVCLNDGTGTRIKIAKGSASH